MMTAEEMIEKIVFAVNEGHPEEITYENIVVLAKTFESEVRRDQVEKDAGIADDPDHVVGGNGYYDECGKAIRSQLKEEV